MRHLLLIVAFLFVVSCSQEVPTSFNQETAIETLKVLSADDMQGRRAGTAGNAKARAYLLQRINQFGLKPVGSSYEHPFVFKRGGNDEPEVEVNGVNLLFRMEGRGKTGKTIVVSAHYDHVGMNDVGEIFNGADDNASGVVGVLVIAEYFKTNPPENDIIFALFDAEEMGLQGAKAFVSNMSEIDPNIAFNINFDMLSRSDKNELYVAGVFHRPYLKPAVQDIARRVPVKLLMGHDDPALGPNDWTQSSDHGPFHNADVPFLYFGVEDHPHYHKISDEFDSVPIDFFLRSLQSVIIAADEVDAYLAVS